MFWNDFPWTNFNELNLDWVFKTIKEQGIAIADNAKKIDDTYSYISENLEEIVDEKLPAIISSLQSVIINVKWYGATGDGTTDDSDSIRAALAVGNILYFPEGTYRFKEIETGNPVIIFGDGAKTVFTPIHKHAGTNQGYKLFDFQNSVYLHNLQLKFDTSVTTPSGAKYYQEAAFYAVGVDHVHLDHIIFDNIFDTYHLGVGTLDFEDRQGLAIYFHNCNEVCINDCEIKEFGGEEFAWISRTTARYGSGKISIQNNYFHDRTSQDKGSAFTVLGGNLIFTDNCCYNFNNIYPWDTVNKAGSLFNLMGAYITCTNNIFIDCLCGNYIDFSEGYYNKVEELIVANNIFNGKALSPMRFMAKNVTIDGNYIDSVLAFRGFIIDAIPASGIPYCVDGNTLYEFDNVTITNNNFHIGVVPFATAYPTGSYNVYLGIGQYPSGQAPIYKKMVISGNHFTRDPDNITHDVIWSACMFEDITIANNIFDSGSAGSLNSVGAATKGFIGGSGYDTANNLIGQVNIIGNTFVCDENTTYDILGGDSTYRPHISHLLSNNTAVTYIGFSGTVYDHVAPENQWARTQSNNNFQITDRT